jgi:hypothetical protein
MAYAEGTSVPVERSRAAIEALLMKHKCSKFMAGVDHIARQATVQFAAHERVVCFELSLPDPKARAFTHRRNGGQSRSAVEAARLYEQALRSRWRALLLVIKAKLEAVESGIATFEDEFLAHVVLPNAQTVAQYIGPVIAQVYLTGRMPPERQLTSGGEVIDAGP